MECKKNWTKIDLLENRLFLLTPLTLWAKHTHARNNKSYLYGAKQTLSHSNWELGYKQPQNEFQKKGKLWNIIKATAIKMVNCIPLWMNDAIAHNSTKQTHRNCSILYQNTWISSGNQWFEGQSSSALLQIFPGYNIQFHFMQIHSPCISSWNNETCTFYMISSYWYSVHKNCFMLICLMDCGTFIFTFHGFCFLFFIRLFCKMKLMVCNALVLIIIPVHLIHFRRLVVSKIIIQ